MQHLFLHPLFAAPGASAELTGLVAVAGFYAIPIVIVGLALFFRYRRRKLQHDTLRMFLEKGQPIPPQLLTGSLRGFDDSYPRNDLRRGLIWLAIGAALSFGHISFGGAAGTSIHISRIGLIPLFIGVAYLISYFTQGRGKPVANGTPPVIPNPQTTSNPGNPSGPTPG